MRLAQPDAGRSGVGLLALLLAMVALVGQVALGGLGPTRDATGQAAAELASAAVLCQTNPGAQHDPAAPRRHPPAAPALCPLAIALASPALLPLADALRPAPPAAPRPVWRETASARAPPSAASGIGYPRGPPATG